MVICCSTVPSALFSRRSPVRCTLCALLISTRLGISSAFERAPNWQHTVRQSAKSSFGSITVVTVGVGCAVFLLLFVVVGQTRPYFLLLFWTTKSIRRLFLWPSADFVAKFVVVVVVDVVVVCVAVVGPVVPFCAILRAKY